MQGSIPVAPLPAGRDRTQPVPAEGRPVPGDEAVPAGNAAAAPPHTRPSLLLVLLRALSAWGA